MKLYILPAVHFFITVLVGACVNNGDSTQEIDKFGEWRNLPMDKDMRIFTDSYYSFDIDVNRRICNKSYVRISLDEKVVDYSQILSDKLTHLYEEGGGTLILRSGTYPIGSNILLRSNTCMHGAGMNETVLKVLDNSKPLYPEAGYLRAKHSENISLLHFTVDGNAPNQNVSTDEAGYGRYGLYFELVNYVWINGVRLKNNNYYGCELLYSAV